MNSFIFPQPCIYPCPLPLNYKKTKKVPCFNQRPISIFMFPLSYIINFFLLTGSLLSTIVFPHA